MRLHPVLRLVPLRLAAALPAAALLATAAASQTLLTGDHSIDGKLCVGLDCTGSETFGNEGVKIKQINPRLVFEDTSTTGSTNDWMLMANATGVGTASFLAIKDVETGQQVFKVEGGAPENSLKVTSSGYVGLGTAYPNVNLHIVDGALPRINLEQDGSGGNTPANWGFYVDAYGRFRIVDYTSSPIARFPINIEAGDPTVANQRINFHDNGNILIDNGVYSNPSDARFHLKFNDGTAKLKVEETIATVSPRTLLELKNKGRPEIVMANTDTGGEWSFGAGTKFILKQGAVGTASSAKTKLFEISDTGDATLTGSLTTGGTTCGGGCDRVFTETAILPQPAYARQMWAQGFLPHVGPTPEGAPLNVSQKLGGMLNALEHAHVFIDRQGARIDGQAALIEAQTALIEAQNRRIADLEQRVTRLVDLQDNRKGPSQ